MILPLTSYYEIILPANSRSYSGGVFCIYIYLISKFQCIGASRMIY